MLDMMEESIKPTRCLDNLTFLIPKYQSDLKRLRLLVHRLDKLKKQEKKDVKEGTSKLETERDHLVRRSESR